MQRSTLRSLGDLLDGLGIRWVLIGALAANRYRTSPRLTQDVDLLLSDAGASLETLEASLRSAGWDVQRASPEAELIRLRHAEQGIADLMFAGTDYQHEAIRRAREELFDDGASARVLTPEDVIVHKLIAGRSQDIADIEAILAAKQTLDEGYIEQWAAYWDVLASWRSLH